jgi:hypothetical protein
MRGPASQRNQLFIAADYPNGIPEHPIPTPNRSNPIIIRSHSHTSRTPAQEPIVRFDIRTQVARSSGPGPARTHCRIVNATQRVRRSRALQAAYTAPFMTRRGVYS